MAELTQALQHLQTTSKHAHAMNRSACKRQVSQNSEKSKEYKADSKSKPTVNKNLIYSGEGCESLKVKTDEGTCEITGGIESSKIGARGH